MKHFLHQTSKCFYGSKYNNILQIKRLNVPKYSTLTSSSTVTMDQDKQIKRQILELATDKYIQEKGWTTDTLAMSAQELGFSVMAHSLFPRGAIELVEFVMLQTARQMSDTVRQLDNYSRMKPKEVVEHAIKIHLQLLSPFIKSGRWSEAIALGLFGSNEKDTFPFSSLITNSTSSLYNIAVIADEICFLAKSTDTDMQWYTKRAGIAAIYSATQIHMLADQSPGYDDTWAFLHQKVEEGAAFHETVLLIVQLF